MGVYEVFVSTWHRGSEPPVKSDIEQLRLLEEALGIQFPTEYFEAVTQIGLPRVGNDIWEWVSDVERDQQLGDGPYRQSLGDFYSPTAIREALGWHDAEMPRDLIPFASDNGGNQIAFSKTEMNDPPELLRHVYFWDHGLGTTERAGDTFLDWINLYLPPL